MEHILTIWAIVVLRTIHHVFRRVRTIVSAALSHRSRPSRMALVVIAATLQWMACAQVTSAQEISTVVIGSATVEPGSIAQIELALNVVDRDLRALEVGIDYDPSVISPVDCAIPEESPLNDALCNLQFDENTVNIAWATGDSGFSGNASIALQFEAIGSDGSSSLLQLNVAVFGDEYEDFPYTVLNGSVQIQSSPDGSENIYLPYLRSAPVW